MRMTEESHVLRVLEAYAPLDAALKQHLLRSLRRKDYPKGWLLLRPGQRPSEAWFLGKGAARGYILDGEKGEEVTTWFWLEGEVVVALDSFCRQVPATFYLELLEDSSLHGLSFQELERMAACFPAFRQVERAIVEDYLLQIFRHYHEQSRLPARARFEKLMEERPRLFHIAPVKHIASFLGMFPDTLSRLRGSR
jgi:CRP/FNR family transcriptional regulator, anaerobic regulatory protein